MKWAFLTTRQAWANSGKEIWTYRTKAKGAKQLMLYNVWDWSEKKATRGRLIIHMILQHERENEESVFRI